MKQRLLFFVMCSVICGDISAAENNATKEVSQEQCRPARSRKYVRTDTTTIQDQQEMARRQELARDDEVTSEANLNALIRHKTRIRKQESKSDAERNAAAIHYLSTPIDPQSDAYKQKETEAVTQGQALDDDALKTVDLSQGSDLTAGKKRKNRCVIL